MFCENCGTQLPNDATVCSVCGAIINKQVEEPQMQQPNNMYGTSYNGYTQAEPMYSGYADNTYTSADNAYATTDNGYATTDNGYTYTNPDSAYNYADNGDYYQSSDEVFYTPYAADNTAMIESLASGALTMGILSLCLCFVPVLGIIFAVKGKNRASKYASMTSAHSGKATTGRILSIFGLVFSIILTPFTAILFLFFPFFG